MIRHLKRHERIERLFTTHARVKRCYGIGAVQFQQTNKKKPGIEDDNLVIVKMSNDPWFRGMEAEEAEMPKSQITKETKQVKQVAALDSSSSSIGHDRFRAGPTDDRENPRLPSTGNDFG